MINSIIKRDGSTQPFSVQKIQDAIEKSFTASGDTAPRIAARIANKIASLDRDSIHVEEVQDLVENMLMKSEYTEVAKEYIRYRAERTKRRRARTDSVLKSIVDVEQNDVTTENGNMIADTPSGMMMKFASVTSKRYALDYLVSEEAAEAHSSGRIHIHDLDYYVTRSLTCIQHPLDKILQNGFTAGHGESRPAKRIETASILGCISLETVQNEMHGGQAIPALDFYLAPYVRSTYEEELYKVLSIAHQNDDVFKRISQFKVTDYLIDTTPVLDRELEYQRQAINGTVRRVHQAMEAFVHNLNTIHSRGGNQVVFSSVNYGTDTSAEGRCIIREIINTTIRGIGEGATAIFPIQIWKMKSGVSVNPGDPNYDLFQLACECASTRFFPNFLNLDAPFNQDVLWHADDPRRFEHEVATMGCRTRVFDNCFGPRTSIGRGNLSFTTINLPYLALQSKGFIGDFYDLLDATLELTARQLNDRFKFQSEGLKRSFPLLMSGLWNNSENLSPNDYVSSVINQGTLGIGFVGLAETLVALTGKHHGESEDSQKLGLEIITHMFEFAKKATEKYKHNFSILATPAESTAGRLLKAARSKFGVIEGVTDKDYFTNSNHIPVTYKISAKNKLELEAPYHALTLGGHIAYVELDGCYANPQAVEDAAHMMHDLNIGYGSINYNANICLTCGHEWHGKNSDTCPHCKSTNVDSLARITGYLVGSVKTRFNSGKRAEFHDRVEHSVVS